MPNQPAYVPNDGAWPFLGIDVNTPSTSASLSTSPDAENVDFLRGYLSKRRGSVRLGSNVPDGNSVIAIVQYQTIGGSIETLISTTAHQYKLSAGGWTDITQATGALTGTIADGIQAIVGTDNTGRHCIITNGVDPVKWYSGTNTFTNLPTGIPSFQTAQSIAVYSYSLFLANVTSTQDEPQTVYWSDTTDFTNFTTGNSGANLLPDLVGAIQRIEVLGDRLAIYSEDSIAVAWYIGDTTIFQFETLAHKTRLLSGRAVANVGLVHLFAGRENIYAFDGTRLVRPVGDAIRSKYREALYLDRASEAFAFHDANDNRAFFIIPGQTGYSTVFVYEFDKSNPTLGTWTIHEYASETTAMGYYTRAYGGEADTWATDDGTWDDWGGIWDEITDRGSFPVVTFGVSGQVLESSDAYFSDNGTAVTAYWTSNDLVVPGNWPSARGRWLELEMEASGSSVTVAYSTDGGRNFTDAATVTLGTDSDVYLVYFDAVSRTLRLKFYASGSETFKIIRFRAKVRYAGQI
jgi:hypothetical protein